MEENQNNQAQETSNFQGSGVSFPTINSQETKKSGGAKTFLIIGILVLVGVLGFVIYKSATTESEPMADPTPFDNLTDTTVSTPLATTTPTPAGTPKASIDKSKITIQVQNGTGTPGDAAYLQTQLKDLGYTDVKAGNATEQNQTTTTVTFSTKLDASIVSEITQKLNALYQTVTTKTSSTQTFDVVVVTGTKKGTSAASTATPRSTATPTGTPKATASPTVKPTSTP